VFQIMLASFITGFVCFLLGCWYQQRNSNTKVGTPSASHNRPIMQVCPVCGSSVSLQPSLGANIYGCCKCEWYGKPA